MCDNHRLSVPRVVVVLLTVAAIAVSALIPGADAQSAGLVGYHADAIIGQGNVAQLQHAQDVSFEFVELKTTMTVWADDKGDVVLQQRVRNTGSEPMTEFSWGFSFGESDYQPVRVWDEIGPLKYEVTEDQNGVSVKAIFRQPLQQNSEYQFAMTISIAGMTDTTGNDGLARWTVSPGARVRSFVHGVTLPLSASMQSITPQADKQVHSYLEWQRTDTSDPISVEISYTLRDDIPNVPDFLQKDDHWGSDTWYTYPPNTPYETIGKWGCNLTSVAMLINYYAESTGATARTTPGQLNAWIRSKGIDSVSAIYPAAMSYAKELGVSLYMPENPYLSSGSAGTQRLNTYLRTGNPVILRVNAASASGIHFVVATGIVNQNGQTTYTINDPIYGRITVADKYPEGFTQVNLFNSTSPDQRTLMSIIHSPAELVVVDPQGRRTGIDPITGEEFNEIPGAVYVRNNIAPATDEGEQEPLDEKFVFVPSPMDGAYLVRVIGTASGSYRVENVATDWDGGISSAEFTGVTSVGQVDEQTVSYDGILGMPTQWVFLPTILR